MADPFPILHASRPPYLRFCVCYAVRLYAFSLFEGRRFGSRSVAPRRWGRGGLPCLRGLVYVWPLCVATRLHVLFATRLRVATRCYPFTRVIRYTFVRCYPFIRGYPFIRCFSLIRCLLSAYTLLLAYALLSAVCVLRSSCERCFSLRVCSLSVLTLCCCCARVLLGAWLSLACGVIAPPVAFTRFVVVVASTVAFIRLASVCVSSCSCARLPSLPPLVLVSFDFPSCSHPSARSVSVAPTACVCTAWPRALCACALAALRCFYSCLYAHSARLQLPRA